MRVTILQVCCCANKYEHRIPSCAPSGLLDLTLQPSAMQLTCQTTTHTKKTNFGGQPRAQTKPKLSSLHFEPSNSRRLGPAKRGAYCRHPIRWEGFGPQVGQLDREDAGQPQATCFDFFCGNWTICCATKAAPTQKAPTPGLKPG